MLLLCQWVLAAAASTLDPGFYMPLIVSVLII